MFLQEASESFVIKEAGFAFSTSKKKSATKAPSKYDRPRPQEIFLSAVVIFL